jgi:hypothetical protein
MSAKTAVVAVVIAGVVAGAGALAFLVLSNAPGEPVDEDPSGGGPGPAALTDDGSGGPVVPEEPVARDPNAAPAPDGGAPWLDFAPSQQALDAIDWREVGKAYAELVPLLEAKTRALVRDEPFPAGQAERIAEIRAAIDALAAPFEESSRHLFGRGALARPEFVANAMAATLHARGRGLSVVQLEQFAAVLATATRDDATLIAMQSDARFTTVVRAAIQCEARQTRGRELDFVLKDRQKRLLTPDSIRGRVGLDPFGAPEILRDQLVVLLVKDGEDGAAQLVERVAQELPADDVRRAEAQALVRPYAQDILDGQTPERIRNPDRAGHVPIGAAIMMTRRADQMLGDIVAIFTDGNPGLVPPQVRDRPIILIRAEGD